MSKDKSIDDYRKKRDFGKTPEPAASEALQEYLG